MMLRLTSTILLCMLLLTGGCRQSSVSEEDAARISRLQNLVLASLDNDKSARAIELLAELETLVPNDAFIPAARGLIALRANDISTATTLLADAAARAPNTPAISLLQAESATLGGNPAGAQAILHAAAVAHPDNIRLRWALCEVLRRSPTPENRDTLIAQLQAIVETTPRNLAARLALTRELLGDERLAEAREHVKWIEASGVAPDEQARSLIAGVFGAISSGEARLARSQAIALDNVLKPTRTRQQSWIDLSGVPWPQGEPLRTLTSIDIPASQPISPPQVQWHDSTETLGEHSALLAMLLRERPEAQPILVTADEVGVTIEQGDHAATIPIDGVVKLLALDWNNDAQLDIAAGTEDGRVIVMESGTWTTPTVVKATGEPVRVLTPWDADQDGDLDILLGRGGGVELLRNNGDSTATLVVIDSGLSITHADILDVDDDGAVDLAAIGPGGRPFIFKNNRAGRITPGVPIGDATGLVTLTSNDYDNDGRLDLAWIDGDGNVTIARNENGFEAVSIGTVSGASDLRGLDFDNDGWMDLVASGERVSVLRNGGLGGFSPPRRIAAGRDAQPVDFDLDGDLDLLVLDDQRVVLLEHEGAPGQAWQLIRLEAILEGGQRNNAFGIGGIIETRAGGAYQKRIIRDAVTHLGLGPVESAEYIRVIWPNGVPQDLLEPSANEVFVEKQILKGSCPFLAVRGDDGLEFITDLLWRSPLGMKVNAQTVPPIATTRDWVKINGRSVEERDGHVELAITASLWETHFIDMVTLVAVDHPPDVDVFVDERFSIPPQPYQVHAVAGLTSPVSATDHRGRDVLNIISARDGNRLGGFKKGRYQGIGERHFVDLDLGDWSDNQTVKIIAQGWIRPTDTSINVAAAQGDHAPPMPLRVSVPDGNGAWKAVLPNAGFPAGKNKTIVLTLPANCFEGGDHRVRLETNLEVYWDRIGFAVTEATAPISSNAETAAADLRFLGFPAMNRTGADAPNLPDYNAIQTSPAWRDLEGYYTRFGDVRELLDDVDDRYVIMNAGDEIALTFRVMAPVKPGLVRDYVFISDGWVKDGDWNTVASRTVGPLPHHAMTDYPYPADETPATLRNDHRDWQEYQTRFVTPGSFRNHLRRE
ncbi:MAG: FG-GAP-like repeat-containing protein [Phycisphaerales bacterium]|nr:FG-GAP-like repeat-containing protein [Phycisphaerales bacterium]